MVCDKNLKKSLRRAITDFAGTERVMEARRIVARVDQLMSLCAELEAGIMRSQADSEKLMEVVVGRMLAE